MKNVKGKSKEEIEELFELVQKNGDEKAKEELLEHFLPYGRKIAAKTAKLDDLDDIMQEISLNFLRGFELFDLKSGNKFETYSHFWVKCALAKSKRSTMLKFSKKQQEIFAKASKTFAKGGNSLEVLEEESEAFKNREPQTLDAMKEAGFEPLADDLSALDTINAHEIVEALKRVASKINDPKKVEVFQLKNGMNEEFEIINAPLSIEEIAKKLEKHRTTISKYDQDFQDQIRTNINIDDFSNFSVSGV
jgi:RNA polymerase sigma factor (sigma-70 family)